MQASVISMRVKASEGKQDLYHSMSCKHVMRDRVVTDYTKKSIIISALQDASGIKVQLPKLAQK